MLSHIHGLRQSSVGRYYSVPASLSEFITEFMRLTKSLKGFWGFGKISPSFICKTKENVIIFWNRIF